MAYCQPGKCNFKFQKMIANKEKNIKSFYFAQTQFGRLYRTRDLSFYVRTPLTSISKLRPKSYEKRNICKIRFCQIFVCKSVDWFQYDRDLRHERIEAYQVDNYLRCVFPLSNYLIICHIEPRNFLRFLCISKISFLFFSCRGFFLFTTTAI